MKKRITQMSNCLFASFMQINTKLLCVMILLFMFMSITFSLPSNNNTFTNPDCTDSQIDTQASLNTVNPPVILFIEPVADICLNSNTGLESLEVTIQGGDGSGIGVWSGPGVVPPNFFNPALANIGPNIITYTFVENGCIVIETTTINVYFSPSASFSTTSPICVDELATISTTPINGNIYNWDFSSGTIISGFGPGPYEIAWPNAGTYPVTLSVTNLNGCTSNLFTQIVTVDTPLLPPTIYCNTSSSMIEFGWDNVDSAIGYTVNVISGASGIQTGNTYTVSPLNMNDSVTIELTVQGDAPCGDVSLTQTCYATDCPNIMITLDPVSDFCLTEDILPFNLTANVSNNSTGIGVWSGNGILDTLSGLFDPKHPAVNFGSNTITYTFTEQGCEFTESMIINVRETPTISIDSVEEISCALSQIELNAMISGSNLDLQWTGGNILFGDKTVNPIVDLPSWYYLSATDSITGCVALDSIEILSNQNPPHIVLVTPENLDCKTSAVTLDASGSITGSNIITEWLGPTGGIIGPTDDLITTVMLPGVYTLTLVDTLNGCESDTSFIVRKIDNGPTATTNIPYDLDCNTTEVEINGSTSTGIGTLNFEWSYNDIVISQEMSTTVSEEGTYTLIVTNSNNKCSDTTFVDVFETSHAITSANISFREPTCHGEDDGVLLINDVFGGTAPFVYTLDLNNFTTSNYIEGLSAGEYTLTVSDQENCNWDTSITIIDPPAFTLDLGDEIQLQLGENVTISANFNIPDSSVQAISWTPMQRVECVDSLSNICTEVTALPLYDLLVSAVLTDVNGCSVTDDVLLKVDKDQIVFIPNIFTPNGDNQNDVFMIYADKGVEKVNQFFVYDRWGEIMYESYDFLPNDPTYGWKGQLKGKSLNSAVFVYWAEVKLLDGQTVVFSGDVTLLK
jgi:gliding motility-associated-like protein